MIYFIRLLVIHPKWNIFQKFTWTILSAYSISLYLSHTVALIQHFRRKFPRYILAQNRVSNTIFLFVRNLVSKPLTLTSKTWTKCFVSCWYDKRRRTYDYTHLYIETSDLCNERGDTSVYIVLKSNNKRTFSLYKCTWFPLLLQISSQDTIRRKLFCGFRKRLF